jgi:hypothetical protein
MFCTGIKGEVVSGRKIFLGEQRHQFCNSEYIDLTWLVIRQWERSKLGFPLNILYIFVSSTMLANRITQIAAISDAGNTFYLLHKQKPSLSPMLFKLRFHAWVSKECGYMVFVHEYHKSLCRKTAKRIGLGESLSIRNIIKSRDP